MFSRLRWSPLRSVVDDLSVVGVWGIDILYQVFTGAIPFGDKPSHAAMQAIVGGERPTRPTDPTLTDRLWELTQRCWDQDMRRRPHALRISCSL